MTTLLDTPNFAADVFTADVDSGILDAEQADAIAAQMKQWAVEKGATHFCHWFQPLTGLTAEKHDSLAAFSGRELIQGEPDASSFPNGGIRATFEARGYTAWDPTSPAFVLGRTLYIPTVFASFTGEALDHKLPLLRSMDAISAAAVKALRLLGEDAERVLATVGIEQEYFLVDERFYLERPDLMTTGRTLFGARPPKGQELDDHYFGSIPERVLACMIEAERELVRLGVPVTTRHNEVAPGQYEFAPVFETANVAADHQQLTMQVLENVARRHGLVCLLHEKPFAGVNGSGKHNNWSLATDGGENLLSPGATPHENLRFLFFCAAVIRAVDTHQGLLRATAASAGQDQRLGGNEAPPAIVSMFLGSELEAIFEAFARGEAAAEAQEERLALGTPVLPRLRKHGGDRNRTSPMAFTGAKFEFRMPGAAQSTSLATTVLNTIVADSVEALAGELAERLGDGERLEHAVREIVAGTYRRHGRIVFDGDGYAAEWEREAAARGLLNLRTTPDALPHLVSDATVRVFAERGVLSARELEARHDVLAEQYATTIDIEAETAAALARTLLLPAALRQRALIAEAGGAPADELLAELDDPLADFLAALRALEAAPDDRVAAMAALREHADRLERLVAGDLWPLPKYAELLFVR